MFKECEGELRTERKDPMATTKLRTKLCERSGGRWSVRGAQTLTSTKWLIDVAHP